MNKTKPRYQLATAVKEDIYERIFAIREKGFTLGDILIAGIEVLEKKSVRPNR